MDLLTEVRSQIESLVREGSTAATELVLAKYPELRSDRDALLELVYTEISVYEELGGEIDLEQLVRRFPDFHRDLSRLVEVHHAMNSDITYAGKGTTWTKGEVDLADDDDDEDDSIVDPLASKQSDYKLLQPIGHGGTSIVYLARQISLQRDVAVKLVNHALINHGAKRFQLEARASARLKHPNIVPIIDVFEVDGHSALAMEFMAGGSLADRISESAMQSEEAAKLLSKLAKAIGYANDEGIIHRDLKPANVLLTRTGEPKITDFGLAKHVWNDDAESQQLTQTGAALGSPCYMSPEQASGNSMSISRATDVYGLGTILYEVLTKRPPHSGANQLATLQMIQDQEVESLRKHSPDIPRDLENICLKCLQKDPLRRYRSAYDLADDLDAFLSGRPVVARPIGTLEKLAKACRRHPTVAALSAGMLALSIASFVTVVSLWLRAEKQTEKTRQQRNQANQSFAHAMDVVDKLTDQVRKIPPSPDSDRIQRQAYAEVKDFYDAYAKIRPNDPVLKSQTARAHFRLAYTARLLGDRDGARSSAEIAVKLYRELSGASPDDQKLYGQYGHALWQLATTLRGVNVEEALYNFDLAIEVFEKLVAKDDSNWKNKVDFANALSNRASTYHNLGELDKAFLSVDQSVKLLEPISDQHERIAFELSLALEVLGQIQMARGEWQPAYEVANRQLELRKSFVDMSLIGDNHKYVARALMALGTIASRLDRKGEAREHFSDAISVQQRLYDQHPTRPEYGHFLNYIYFLLADLENRQGDTESAIALYEKMSDVGLRSVALAEMSIEDRCAFANQTIDASYRLAELERPQTASTTLQELFQSVPELEDGPIFSSLVSKFIKTTSFVIGKSNGDVEELAEILRQAKAID